MRRTYRHYRGPAIPDGWKRCPECEQVLPHDNYWKRKTGQIETYCKTCAALRCIASKLKVSVPLVRELRAIRACQICGTTDPAPRANFCIDHDHEAGLVRGVLCLNCNAFLGKAKDSVDVLRAAAAYLIRHTASRRAA